MKQIEIHTHITLFDSKKELPDEVFQLMKEAESARENAYAPYSKFKVGAAVLLDNGVIITGNNQENAAYPSGLCAERVAVYYANSQHPNVSVQKMAITARSETQNLDAPIPPCGSCRQAIAEYEVKQEKPIEIYFMGEMGKVAKADSLKALLPLIFDKNYLK